MKIKVNLRLEELDEGLERDLLINNIQVKQDGDRFEFSGQYSDIYHVFKEWFDPDEFDLDELYDVIPN